MSSARTPLAARTQNVPAATPRAACKSSSTAEGPVLGRDLAAVVQELEQVIDWMQTDDAASSRAKQKGVLKKYMERYRENSRLARERAEAHAAHHAHVAATAAELASLRAQLYAQGEEARTDVQDMTENVLELEGKLVQVRRQLRETQKGTDGLEQCRKACHELEQQSEDRLKRCTRLEAELQAAKDDAARLAEELAIVQRQHIVGQQDIQRLERRVRELTRAHPAASDDIVAVGSGGGGAVVSTPIAHTPRGALPPPSPAPPAARLQHPQHRAQAITALPPRAQVEVYSPGPTVRWPLCRQPCLSGCLTKRSNGKFAKDGKRYFHLFDLALCYHKDVDAHPAGGTSGIPVPADSSGTVTIELAHARAVPDPSSKRAFHVLTPERAYSLAAPDAGACRGWLAALRRCVHDAALIFASALHHDSVVSDVVARPCSGYLVRASSKGKGKKVHIEPDASHWTLNWWCISEDGTLDCYASSAYCDTHDASLTESHDLAGSSIALVQGGPLPAFELTLRKPEGKTQECRFRLHCSDITELHNWTMWLQEAIQRTEDPHGQMKGWLTKEVPPGRTGGVESEHRRWFVAKNGTLRGYAKPADAHSSSSSAAVVELDLWNATLDTRIDASKPMRFELRTQTKNIGLLAPSAPERSRWLQVLQCNIDAEQSNRASVQNHEGYLLKRSSGLVKNTDFRWFCLRNGRLSCSKLQADPKPRWTIDLSVNASISLCPDDDKASSSGLTFTVSAMDGARVLTLTAANTHDFDVWVHAIQATIVAAQHRSSGRRQMNMRRGRSPSCPPFALERTKEGAVDYYRAADTTADTSPPVRRARLSSKVLTESYRREYGHEALQRRQEERLARVHDEASIAAETEQARPRQRRPSLGTWTASLKQYVPMPGSPQGALVVVECGSEYIRAGFSGEPAPRVVVPSVCTEGESGGGGALACGWQALEVWRSSGGAAPLHSIFPRGSEASRTPSSSEIDWYGAILPMLRHVIVHELGLCPGEQGLVVVEPPAITPADREELLEMALEELGVPELSVLRPAPLALRAARTGGATALVVSWGNTLTITPICDGTVEEMAVRTVRFGGMEVTAHLAQLLESQHGISAQQLDKQEDDGDCSRCTLDFEACLTQLKESEVFVAQDFAQEEAAATRQRHVRLGGATDRGARDGSGHVVTIDSSLLCRCAEVLFDPSIAGYDMEGVHHMIGAAISAAPVDYRASLLRHIVVVGGTTCIRGFPERLQAEVASLPRCGKARVLASRSRKYQSWSGSAAAASEPMFSRMLFCKEDWEMHGVDVLHRGSCSMTDDDDSFS